MSEYTDNGHVILTPEQCRKQTLAEIPGDDPWKMDCMDHHDATCNICVGGLAYCTVCNGGEAQLDTPCAVRQKLNRADSICDECGMESGQHNMACSHTPNVNEIYGMMGAPSPIVPYTLSIFSDDLLPKVAVALMNNRVPSISPAISNHLLDIALAAEKAVGMLPPERSAEITALQSFTDDLKRLVKTAGHHQDLVIEQLNRYTNPNG